MWTATKVVDVLRKRGELWEPLPGLVSLRGDALAQLMEIERLLAVIARDEGFPEWRLAPGLEFDTLQRADYFASFPQWLTAASHLSDDQGTLEAIARSVDPAAAAAGAVEAPGCALSPALCYHTYARLAGSTVDTVKMTSQGTCWRHEGDRFRALERGWAFTMRELVYVGPGAQVEGFRHQGMGLAAALADALELEGELVAASDPFFAPTARGKALVQKLKALKHELVLPLGDGRTVAAASFNNHERFFGKAFDIRLRDGRLASSACVAFGVERWLLAFLVAHGPDSARWPNSQTKTTTVERYTK